MATKVTLKDIHDLLEQHCFYSTTVYLTKPIGWKNGCGVVTGVRMCHPETIVFYRENLYEEIFNGSLLTAKERKLIYEDIKKQYT